MHAFIRSDLVLAIVIVVALLENSLSSLEHVWLTEGGDILQEALMLSVGLLQQGHLPPELRGQLKGTSIPCA